MTSQPRIVIIGAGPGGYVAAIRAAQLGAHVTIVEDQAVGGICLNWGCIPSKTLLNLVDLGERVRHAEAWGITLQGPIGFDLNRMMTRKNAVVQSLVKGITTLFKQWKIHHIAGRGELVSDRQVRVTHADGATSLVEAEAVILATGSSWPQLPQFPIDGQQVITSKEAFDLTEVPPSIVIVGGGVEGCEFACLFSGLGSQVTIIEMAQTLLPTEDEAIVAILNRELKKRKVQIYVNETVQNWDSATDGIRITTNAGKSVVAQKMLICIGRRLNSTELGLEAVGVKTGNRNEILVNEHMETSVPGIFAIGDVTGKSMLAHVASAQGKVAVANIMGTSQSMSYAVIPAGIFTLPEIGRVGMTEQQVRDRGMTPAIGQFRYGGLGKAQAVGSAIGQFKIVADEQKKNILGIHIIGAHAADLVHEGALAMQAGLGVSEVANLIHAHPTLSEGMMEVAEAIEGLAIHQGPTGSS